MADTDKYVDLLVPQHQGKPKLEAMLRLLTGAVAGTCEAVRSMPERFDVDDAVGAQLDDVALWVGVPRSVPVPITGAFFSLDTVGLGFDQAVWKSPYDAVEGLVELPDAAYVSALKARIFANYWSGAQGDALDAAAGPLKHELGFYAIFLDNQDMTVGLRIWGPYNPVVLELVKRGLFPPKPAGVRVASTVYTPGPLPPFFALDNQGPFLAGLDTGSL